MGLQQSRSKAGLGQQVIVMLGELDCREGLLQAVDKQKYSDLESATCFLAGLYCQVLTQLCEQRHLAGLWVCSVPCFSDESVTVTREFNSALSAQVSGLPSCLTC